MAKQFVRATDTFMSGWGMAEGKKNVLIFECDGILEAMTVKENLLDRDEMKYVNIYDEKPTYNPRKYLVQDKTKEDAPLFYKEGAFRK